MDGTRLAAVKTKKNEGDLRFEADAFVETTGTAGVVNVCNKYGNGCSMCILRCHTFGIRVGIASARTGERSTRRGIVHRECVTWRRSGR